MDNNEIKIRADKTSVGLYNMPTINKVVVIIVKKERDTRDKVLQRRNNTIKHVVETYRSYDAFMRYGILYIP